MRAVVQRVTQAQVTVDGRVVGAIGNGMVALVGVAGGDGHPQAAWLGERLANLRIFPNGDADMEVSLLDTGGAALVISQFTLYGDVRKGRRPSFLRAAPGPEAEPIFQTVVNTLRDLGIEVATGEFGSMMEVTLTNAGPTTILVDGEKAF
ncbi:MAG: D-aminoacyl-tRNA deacylase [Actinomycetota bacterium]|nr:D-aminoacyl-tRNA deacylase [Actinomycetota bacterium]